MIELRPYQREAIDSCLSYWERGGGNPLIDLATGTGKSVVLGQLVREIAEPNEHASILVLTHVKELVEQDARAMLRVWPQCPLGINSAGLGRRDRRSRVLAASIQSVHREDAYSLGKRHLVIIDEAHLVPRDGEGMYRRLLENLRASCPDMRVVGLSATCYRLDSGRLDEGQGKLFDDVVYSYGIGEGVRDGYLSPLVSRNGGTDGQIDARGVARRGGEFIPGALEASANTDALVRAACQDIAARGGDRRGWICFGTGVVHAEAIAGELRRMGIAAACVTGDTPAAERDRLIRDFRAGQLRCLTSVGVLTTGFDVPHVDLIAMLRPTLSTGLYVQMLGRGTRLADGKSNCLVLDYSGNVRRHGPVDAIEIRPSDERGGQGAKTAEDTVRAKVCPACESLVALARKECPDCGHVWPVEAKHVETADTQTFVMAREVEETWHPVDRVEARIHQAREPGKPNTLRVEYWNGAQVHREWICLNHSGFPRDRARAWWIAMTHQRHADGVTVESAVEEIDEGLAEIDCVAVRIKRDGKFWRIVDRMRADGTAVDEKLKIRRVKMQEAA